MVVDREMDRLERISMASHFYQGFKSKKLKSKSSLNKSQITSAVPVFGVTSLPSDNMAKIMTHGFEKEFNSRI